MTEAPVWLILILPLVSFILTDLGYCSPQLRSRDRWAGYLTILAIGASFGLSVWALISVINHNGRAIGFGGHDWLRFGFVNGGTASHMFIPLGVHVDGLTGIMLVVVTGVSLLVQVYALGYMAGDPGFKRFFAVMSLFTASMIGLVLASNILMLFFFWELVGLCSYLLVGFWFQKPSAAAAAKKAFIVTRFGDLGLLAAIIFIWSRTGTFVITDLQSLALNHQIGGFTVGLFAIGVFAGAGGKSAQFPLHIWLPDAMEGPTPISALIHAATMVAAGVYLVARLFPVFSVSSEAMHTVAIVGGITALVGGLIGLVMTDIKRVLAYSTISQLGYMMLGLGTGGYVAGIFHLFNHAFFKALLFLGAGSVGHTSNTFDMRKMGGLRRYQPVTFWTFLIASLALSGIFPFSGFWSKDEILASAFHDNILLWLLGFITVFLTAFYIFRAVFLTFFGEYRGGDPPEVGGGGGPMLLHAQQEEEHERAPLTMDEAAERARGGNWPSGHPHESPWTMLLPMIILALFAIGSGFANITGAFGDLIKGALPVSMRGIDQETTNWGLLLGALAFAFCGIGAAAVVYYYQIGLDKVIGRTLKPAWVFLANKMYLDDLDERGIVGTVYYRGLCVIAQSFDTYVVDFAVNGTAWFTRRIGYYVRLAQNGELQTYGFVFLSGVVLIAALVFALHP